MVVMIISQWLDSHMKILTGVCHWSVSGEMVKVVLESVEIHPSLRPLLVLVEFHGDRKTVIEYR